MHAQRGGHAEMRGVEITHKALAKSVSRTPNGESCRQNPVKPSLVTSPVLPTHRAVVSTPVVKLTCSSRVKPLTKALALAYAGPQPPSPVIGFAGWTIGEVHSSYPAGAVSGMPVVRSAETKMEERDRERMRAERRRGKEDAMIDALRDERAWMVCP